jgi:type VI secretion system protein ImpH
MAAPVGTEDPDITLDEVRELLFREPWTFDFFQAVRLLAQMQPNREAVGRYAHPTDEIVRFGAHPSMSFPASQIQALEEKPGGNPSMVVNFMGLIGPLGVLPDYMTDTAMSRLRARDHTLVDFLNIFNHRLTSFFYQAWEKHHFTVAFERDRNDPLTACLYALVGLGTPGLRERQPVPDEAFVFYSGLFGLLPRSALALETVLAGYFDVPVEVEPFMGTWRRLNSEDQCVFGESEESNQVGFGAVVGDEVWDRTSRVRLKFGPLSAARYGDFLPTGSAWPELKAMVKTFSGHDLEFEIQLILKREDVPPCQLRDPEEGALQLGWHTWLKSAAQFNRDPGDAILLL